MIDEVKRSLFKETLHDLQLKLDRRINTLNDEELMKYLNSTDGTLAILQWELFSKVDERSGYIDLVNDTCQWILKTPEPLEMLMTSGNFSLGHYE